MLSTVVEVNVPDAQGSPSEGKPWYQATVIDILEDRNAVRVAFDGNVWPEQEIPAACVRNTDYSTPEERDATFHPMVGDTVEAEFSETAQLPKYWKVGTIAHVKDCFYYVDFQTQNEPFQRPGHSRQFSGLILEKHHLRPLNRRPPIDVSRVKRDRLPVPPELTRWAQSPEHLIVLSQTEQQAGLVKAWMSPLPDPPSGSASAQGGRGRLDVPRLEVTLLGEEKSIHKGGMLLEQHFKHLVELEKIKDMKARRERILEERKARFDNSIKDEFHVPRSCVGPIIGKKGQNINDIQQKHNVQCHVIDSTSEGATEESAIVRIFGQTREAVQSAREELEYAEEDFIFEPEMKQYLLGDRGRSIDEICQKTRLIRAHMSEKRNNALTLVGLRLHVMDAMELLSVQKEYFATREKFQREDEEIKRNIQEIDMRTRGPARARQEKEREERERGRGGIRGQRGDGPPGPRGRPIPEDQDPFGPVEGGGNAFRGQQRDRGNDFRGPGPRADGPRRGAGPDRDMGPGAGPRGRDGPGQREDVRMAPEPRGAAGRRGGGGFPRPEEGQGPVTDSANFPPLGHDGGVGATGGGRGRRGGRGGGRGGAGEDNRAPPREEASGAHAEGRPGSRNAAEGGGNDLNALQTRVREGDERGNGGERERERKRGGRREKERQQQAQQREAGMPPERERGEDAKDQSFDMRNGHYGGGNDVRNGDGRSHEDGRNGSGPNNSANALGGTSGEKEKGGSRRRGGQRYEPKDKEKEKEKAAEGPAEKEEGGEREREKRGGRRRGGKDRGDKAANESQPADAAGPKEKGGKAQQEQADKGGPNRQGGGGKGSGPAKAMYVVKKPAAAGGENDPVRTVQVLKGPEA
uniref:K Homology domain-containing protein n=1 Tax=Chromera velia CCMP2878 TaxID=1169474 RepID=A0A0G4FPA3_9ALVE|eukprot:Cvel_18060.t1-p1 / transcript=Cvel_18060.t1 / gene=Cvel_18060 / organism=Chromera_velia_CCMP2878 / gene_product=Fragile X mental retardation syndrome-related, putative / transcript_product=Fragile X mental retardation syndrome-related, putative / location=Cvel_scaffold1476:20563-27384(-) / protein_length=861 / sequence_SO=supercontig / SO=protein_coding / is_pseudo=false